MANVDPTKHPFGAHSFPLVKDVLPAGAIECWMRPTPLSSRVAMLVNVRAPNETIRAVISSWEAWR